MFTEVRELIEHALKDNQFFSGGFLLGILTAIAAYFRHIPSLIWEGFKRRCTTLVIVDSREDAFMWVQLWLSHHQYGKVARRVLLKVKKNTDPQSQTVYEATQTGKRKRLKTYFTPAPGWHWIRYKNTWLYIDFEREKLPGGNSGAVSLFETLTIRYLGVNRDIIQDIIDDAQNLVLKSDEDYFNIYVDRWTGWQLQQSKLGRPPETLFYSDNLYSRVRQDILNFIESEKRYAELGVPYRRGYLLHGPPGTGKTSLITALAADLGFDVCVARLGKATMAADDFSELMADIKPKSIVLLEDVHVVRNKYKNADDGQSKDDKPLDFPTFINVLDGAYSPEKSIIFMTTNYIDQIDPILMRPGRVDIDFYVGYANKEQIHRMFKKFYSEASEEECIAFSNKLPENKLSMAKLQGYLLKYDQQEALTNIQELIKSDE